MQRHAGYTVSKHVMFANLNVFQSVFETLRAPKFLRVQLRIPPKFRFANDSDT